MPDKNPTIIIVERPGGEFSEKQQAFNTIDGIDSAKQKYAEWDRQKLESEYRRINSDFDLFMKMEFNLHAIEGLLVDKFNATTEEIVKLRS